MSQCGAVAGFTRFPLTNCGANRCSPFVPRAVSPALTLRGLRPGLTHDRPFRTLTSIADGSQENNSHFGGITTIRLPDPDPKSNSGLSADRSRRPRAICRFPVLPSRGSRNPFPNRQVRVGSRPRCPDSSCRRQRTRISKVRFSGCVSGDRSLGHQGDQSRRIVRISGNERTGKSVCRSRRSDRGIRERPVQAAAVGSEKGVAVLSRGILVSDQPDNLFIG
jgi:hypothetical protein